MKNLKHIQIELEEKRAEIKSIDEHEWSDGEISQVSVDKDGDIEIINGRYCYEIYLNDEDLAVLVRLRGFDLVKRS